MIHCHSDLFMLLRWSEIGDGRLASIASGGISLLILNQATAAQHGASLIGFLKLTRYIAADSRQHWRVCLDDLRPWHHGLFPKAIAGSLHAELIARALDGKTGGSGTTSTSRSNGSFRSPSATISRLRPTSAARPAMQRQQSSRCR